MFTMAKIRNGSTYLSAHLSANDYYAEGERVRGYWVGRGAEMLGLRGEVEPDQFEALRRNQRPDSLQPLSPRTRQDRVAFFDFQCSAQKSVSIMAILGDDDRLRGAHEQAAIIAFTELERFASRQQNSRVDRASVITGAVCAAAFGHDASRALDPQLHTHFVVANATVDGCGNWTALNEFEMLKAIRYAGKVYQNELARSVLALGYKIREARDAKGTVTGFEVHGISDEFCERFSKRRAEIECGIQEFRLRKGREPSRQEISTITRETRSSKLATIATSEVRRKQAAQTSAIELAQLRRLRDAAIEKSNYGEQDNAYREQLRAATAHLFERRSVLLQHEVLAEALNQRLGYSKLDDLKHAFSAEPEFVELVSRKDNRLLSEFCTRHGLAMEYWSVAFVNATRGRYSALNREFSPSAGLSEEQRVAVCSMLSMRDQVYSFRGVAGAGKTTVLSELNRGLTEVGASAIYIAPTVAAVKVLREEGFPSSTTVEDFLISGARNDELQNKVVVCDEAGLKSNRQGAQLLRIAQKFQMRVILVGDTRQHSSVEAGDFMRVLEMHSQMGRCEVKEIRRQIPSGYRKAVQRMAEGDASSGLLMLDKLGWIHESGVDYLKCAAAEYVRQIEANAKADDTLLVAPTWSENHEITEEIRKQLVANRFLPADGAKFKVHDSLQWTLQQRRTATNYQIGQTVVFSRCAGRWKAGEIGTVVRLENARSVIILSNGIERRLPLSSAMAFDVGHAREIEIAPGDRLLMRANDKRLKINNGQILTVQSIATDGTISTREGVQIPPTFRQWLHGYAITSHKAQGRTCKHVIVAAERLDSKSAYVACSRGRKSCSIYTPEKLSLLSTLRTAERKSALDVIAQKQLGLNAEKPQEQRLGSRPARWQQILPAIRGKLRSVEQNVRRRIEHLHQRLHRFRSYSVYREQHSVALRRAQRQTPN